MATREARELAKELFMQAAARLGILDWHDGRDVWVDLLSANAPLSEAEQARLESAGRNFAARCLVVAVAAIEVLGAEPVAEARDESPPRYACPGCGSSDVEFSFPVWVRANDIDNRALWDLDVEASPEKDSDKGWCRECQTNVLVRVQPEGGGR
jgi:hypothetical protein